MWPLRALREEGRSVTGFWYNPNIHPAQEYWRRLESCRKFAEHTGLELIESGGYGLREFFARVYPNDKEGSPGARCLICYRWRLEATALAARERGFGSFSTTLLVSPYQQHEAIAEVGREIGAAHGLEFYYADWRPGFRRARNESREMGLYHQVYCGCILSEADRFAGAPQRRANRRPPAGKAS